MQSLWQMPHFYALAWLHKADYIRGGYRMFPLTDATGHATAAMSKPYLLALCAMPWGLAALDLASWMLPIGAAVPSALWWRSLAAFEAKPSAGTCRRFFLGSLSYLLALLALFTAFARGRQASSTRLDGVSDEADADGEPASQGLEPPWRASIHARGLDACPHEKVRYYLFGVGKTGCPLCRDKF